VRELEKIVRDKSRSSVERGQALLELRELRGRRGFEKYCREKFGLGRHIYKLMKMPAAHAAGVTSTADAYLVDRPEKGYPPDDWLRIANSEALRAARLRIAHEEKRRAGR
jgi:hypothetical protein